MPLKYIINRFVLAQLIELARYNYRISLLAFHEALARKPCDPLIVATFALAFYLGGDMSLAVDIGKSINRQHDTGFRELLEPKVWTDKHLAGEVQSFAALMKQTLTEMTDEYHVANAMAKIPQAPSSDLVSTTNLSLPLLGYIFSPMFIVESDLYIL